MGQADREGPEKRGTIVFSTVGRAQYAFDVYALPLTDDFLRGGKLNKEEERPLTDGISVNYNGHLVEGIAKEEVLQWIKKHGEASAGDSEVVDADAATSADDIDLLVHVTERDGCLRIAFSISIDELEQARTTEENFKNLVLISHDAKQQKKIGKVFSAKPLLGDNPGAYLQDRPQIGGGKIVFVSTEQDLESKRQSPAAVYSTTFLAGPSGVVRLTPAGVTDFSPSLSASGKLVVAASLQGKGWQEEVQDLPTDLYVFNAVDGSQRRLLVKNGGWPSWADESTVYFHRVAEDGWWSVFRVSLPESFLTSGEGVIPKESRVTPPGVHAFTPSASRTGKWIAVATRRMGSDIRHVEAFDLHSRKFIKLTETISPGSNHYNPFVSSSNKIVYHRCRGNNSVCDEAAIVPRLEYIKSPIPDLALLRIDGAFPAFSHDGSLIAYCPLSFDSLFVTKLNGEGKRKIFSRRAFGIAWDWKRKDVVYAATGPVFASEGSTVHIISIFGADADPLIGNELSLKEPKYKVLTKEGTGNNAFPSPSPDGKHVVFRSGRNGHKNLYIMDSVRGEEGELRQLTDGAWIDTMPNWSPTGEWIAFSSNRDDPNGAHFAGYIGHFAGYIIHPDGSGLRKILSNGGRVNHLAFSPDGQNLVFTADFGAISAEPVSTPSQFQPYGEIYVSRKDGSGIRRLTHNAYEDGTPCWGSLFVDRSQLSVARGDPAECAFDDHHWLSKAGDAAKDNLDDREASIACTSP